MNKNYKDSFNELKSYEIDKIVCSQKVILTTKNKKSLIMFILPILTDFEICSVYELLKNQINEKSLTNKEYEINFTDKPGNDKKGELIINILSNLKDEMYCKNMTNSDCKEIIQHEIEVVNNPDCKKIITSDRKEMIQYVSEVVKKAESHLRIEIDKPKKFKAKFKIKKEFEVIFNFSPTENQIKKYFESKTFLNENYQEYIKEVNSLYQPSVKWIENIFDKNTEHETIHYEDDKLIILNNYKAGKNTPIDELQLLTIGKDSSIKTLRDIPSVEYVKEFKSTILKVCKDKFNLEPSQLAIFFHYRPQFYWLHVHTINISKTFMFFGDSLRNVLIDDVIKNLQISKDYYQDTIPCLVIE